jgi:hypothetical protein
MIVLVPSKSLLSLMPTGSPAISVGIAFASCTSVPVPSCQVGEEVVAGPWQVAPFEAWALVRCGCIQAQRSRN